MKEQRNMDPTQQPTQRRTPQNTDGNTASPHRAGHAVGIHPEDRPYLTDEQRRPARPQQQQPSPRPVQYRYDDGVGGQDKEEDEVYNTRSPSSTRRYQMPTTQGPRTIVRYHYQQVPLRSSRTQDYAPPPGPQQQYPAPTRSPEKSKATRTQPTHRRREWHWLVYVGLTIIAVIALFVGGSLAFAWWHTCQDDLHYGRPRTAQYDVRVGHNDDHTPSHFLAVNLNKQIEIVEFPGGDVTKAKVYVGPMLTGDGDDLTPVTLTFKDVNRDGKPDMIVHLGDSRTVFVNENGQFRLAKPSDPIIL